MTSKGLGIIQGFSTYFNGFWQVSMKEGTETFLFNYSLDYGLTLGDNEIDKLNEIKISNDDVSISVSNDGNADLYGSTSFVFQWEAGNKNQNLIAYMGGIGSGLIRYNLSVPAGSSGISGQVESKIRDCQTEEELEKKMAEYYLDSKTVKILHENDTATKEELEDAILLRQKTIAVLKEAYVKANKGMTESLWKKQLSSILAAFHEEE